MPCLVDLRISHYDTIASWVPKLTALTRLEVYHIENHADDNSWISCLAHLPRLQYLWLDMPCFESYDEPAEAPLVLPQSLTYLQAHMYQLVNGGALRGLRSATIFRTEDLVLPLRQLEHLGVVNPDLTADEVHAALRPLQSLPLRSFLCSELAMLPPGLTKLTALYIAAPVAAPLLTPYKNLRELTVWPHEDCYATDLAMRELTALTKLELLYPFFDGNGYTSLSPLLALTALCDLSLRFAPAAHSFSYLPHLTSLECRYTGPERFSLHAMSSEMPSMRRIVLHAIEPREPPAEWPECELVCNSNGGAPEDHPALPELHHLASLGHLERLDLLAEGFPTQPRYVAEALGLPPAFYEAASHLVMDAYLAGAASRPLLTVRRLGTKLTWDDV